jgi:hypothetical protein
LRERKQKTLSKRWWFWNARRLTVRFLVPPNYVCIRTCMYVYMYAYVRVCMSMCMYMYVYVCLYVCIRTCMYVYMYVPMDLCVSTLFFWGVKFGLNPQRKYTREYPVSIYS